MGYESTFHGAVFRSPLSLKALSEIINSHPAGLGDEYSICSEGWENGQFQIDSLMGSLSRHSLDKELAEFVSEIITPNTYALVEFTGEDGVDWGYFVSHNKVIPMGYEKRTFVNNMLLDDFIDKEFPEEK